MDSHHPPGRDHWLEEISTQWATVQDPLQFAMRYGSAIHNYLERLLRNKDDADEAAQEFLLRVVQHGFAAARQEHGKFRHYLKVAVRNAALNYLRKKQASQKCQAALAEQLAQAAAAAPDKQWLEDYRDCLLESVWRRLRQHQQSSPGNLYHSVLQAAAEQPEADSPTLAALVSRTSGQPLSAEAFRKQLSRARQLFAAFLVEEVGRTVEPSHPQAVDEELAELGLRSFVAKFLTK